jgi:hypothetical protein
MRLYVAIYAAILFFALSPNILLRIPRNGSKIATAFVHSIVFGLIFWVTQTFSINVEGMNNDEDEESKKESNLYENTEKPIPVNDSSPKTINPI